MKDKDLELLKLAKEKDESAIEQVFAKYKHIVVAIARRYFLIGGDKEDLIQEGMVGLFKAINSFNADKSDNFLGYAGMIIEREIISAIRRVNTGSQQILTKSVLIGDDELGDSACPETEFIAEESTSDLTKEIFGKLSGFEKIVADYYLKGYNYQDIAKITGKSSKCIDNALSRIKKKLEYLKERL